MKEEKKHANQEIMNVCVKMETGDQATFTADHKFNQFELSELETSISLRRSNKGSVVRLNRNPEEKKPRKIILADCFVPM